MSNKNDIREPVLLKSGKYRGQVMRKGERRIIYGSTREEYFEKARIFKQYGFYDKPEEKPHDAEDVAVVELGDIISDYIYSHEKVLALTSVDSYRKLYDALPDDLLNCDIEVIDLQAVMDRIADSHAASTTRNYWTLIKSSLEYAGYTVPIIRLPQLGRSGQKALSSEEIRKLLNYVHGKDIELIILLGLHSLRAGEMMALDREDIFDDLIHICKNRVYDSASNSFIIVPWTKTDKSYRNIRIFIPRLYEILPEKLTLREDFSQTNLSAMVKRACIAAGVTPISFHGLRRSFASICYFLGISEHATMEMGGWGSINTVHEHYVKMDMEALNKDNQKLLDYYAFTTEADKPLE